MHQRKKRTSRLEEAGPVDPIMTSRTASGSMMVIWLLTVITPLAVSARRGLSPGVVICFLLWIIGLLVIASLLARKMGFHVIGMVTGDCDPSYPTLCIPIGTPDLDCADVSASNFRVVGRDPHGFDGDDDGVAGYHGCLLP